MLTVMGKKHTEHNSMIFVICGCNNYGRYVGFFSSVFYIKNYEIITREKNCFMISLVLFQSPGDTGTSLLLVKGKNNENTTMNLRLQVIKNKNNADTILLTISLL